MEQSFNRAHSILMRRHTVAILGCLCSIIMHAQRLNISIALVAMVNSTKLYVSPNVTECPALEKNVTLSEARKGEFSWNPELQGYILSAGFLGYVLTQILGGVLAGRFGSKPVLLAGLLLASICNLISPLSARCHVYLLTAVQLLRGMGQGLQQPSMSVLMSKWFPRSERGFLSAFIYCGYPVGAFIGSLVSGALCEVEFLGGWPLVFYVFGLAGVLLSILLVFLYVERPADDPDISEKELQYILKNQENDTSSRPPSIPWKSLVTSIPTYALTVALFGQYWMAFYFLSVHPTYMGTILHIPIKQNGLLSSGPFLAQAIAGFGACWFSFLLKRRYPDRINACRKGWNSLSCSVFTLGMVGVYLSGCSTTWNEVSFFVAIASVGFGFAGSLITAVDMTPTFCGALMGYASTLASFAGFLVPVTVGRLTNEEQTLAQWQKIFLITAAVGAGSGIIFLVAGSSDIQSWDPAGSKENEKKTPPEENGDVPATAANSSKL
ncbi:putative inorganic phosphate cotransporter [Stegodyphus dumicola]|uniref:putative inorganic phosphate cotransporter n=1 Tax=Stegodyphus dumicola TaxID=202533 RepID=UPI0015A93D3B|nr:putative inorganic phosphate cotransporter [Stegodyphus dumicola]